MAEKHNMKNPAVKRIRREVKEMQSNPSDDFMSLPLENVETLQDRLKEEVAAHEELRRQATRAALEAERQRESSLAEIQAMQDRLSHLESKAYEDEVVEKFRNGAIGKVEVALACKFGFDFLMAQLPRNLQLHPESFYYPPRVANCLSLLREIEAKGGGLFLTIDNGDEEGEEEEEDEDEEARSESRLTPPPSSTAAAPLGSTFAPGSSAAPAPISTPSPSP